jgi:hypothetical protein
MEKETFKKMKEDLIFYRTKANEPLKTWIGDYLEKAIRFIGQLRENGIPLSDININDYNCNTEPSVYVGDKRYSRLAKNDYKLALKSFLG